MSPAPADPNAARRESLLQAAIGVFLRYGYRKASMDDLARAAGLSRQGLYLHFATKEALFQQAVTALIDQSRVAMAAALARDDLGIEDRLLGAFVALKSHGDGTEMSQEHMNELFQTAKQLVGPVIEELDRALLLGLAKALQSSGVAARWKDAGLTAKDLAQHLQAASHGVKQAAKTTADYRERMRVAVRLVCRSPSAPARQAPAP